uniref:Uncharacterized protein n=1 Tax=Solanum tuberosum TaxID=4113 RepID=M1BPS8_SOLTU
MILREKDPFFMKIGGRTNDDFLFDSSLQTTTYFKRNVKADNHGYWKNLQLAIRRTSCWENGQKALATKIATGVMILIESPGNEVWYHQNSTKRD